MFTKAMCPACGRPFYVSHYDGFDPSLTCANIRCPSAASSHPIDFKNLAEAEAIGAARRVALESINDWTE